LFDGYGQLSLMLGACSGYTPRQYLASVCDETAQRIRIPVAHLGFLAAKLAVLSSVK
jgi:hypothetical protein